MKSNDLQYPVLVVDDEADIRDLMEMTLMKMGLRVETAVGVDDAKMVFTLMGLSSLVVDLLHEVASAMKADTTSIVLVFIIYMLLILLSVVQN